MFTLASSSWGTPQQEDLQLVACCHLALTLPTPISTSTTPSPPAHEAASCDPVLRCGLSLDDDGGVQKVEARGGKESGEGKVKRERSKSGRG